jgi:hypothetical protein
MLEGTLREIKERDVPQPQAPASPALEDEPARQPTWLGLIRSSVRDEELSAGIEELLRADIPLGDEDFAAFLNHKRLDIVEQVVSMRVIDPEPRLSDDDGGEPMSLLAFAIKHDFEDRLVMTLIDRGADVRGMVRSGAGFKGIVDVAIERNRDEAVIERLIRNGAPIPSCIGEVPTLEILYKNSRLQVLELLIADGARTDFQIDGRTFLGKILFDWGCLAKQFVREGKWFTKFDLAARGANGQTALHDLCEGEFSQSSFGTISGILEGMIKLGADPYSQNKDGKTPVALLFETVRKKTGNVLRTERRALERKIAKLVKKS